MTGKKHFERMWKHAIYQKRQQTLAIHLNQQFKSLVHQPSKQQATYCLQLLARLDEWNLHRQDVEDACHDILYPKPKKQSSLSIVKWIYGTLAHPRLAQRLNIRHVEGAFNQLLQGYSYRKPLCEWKKQHMTFLLNNWNQPFSDTMYACQVLCEPNQSQYHTPLQSLDFWTAAFSASIRKDPWQAFEWLNRWQREHRLEPDLKLLMLFFHGFFDHRAYDEALAIFIIMKRWYWPLEKEIFQEIILRYQRKLAIPGAHVQIISLHFSKILKQGRWARVKHRGH